MQKKIVDLVSSYRFDCNYFLGVFKNDSFIVHPKVVVQNKKESQYIFGHESKQTYLLMYKDERKTEKIVQIN